MLPKKWGPFKRGALLLGPFIGTLLTHTILMSILAIQRSLITLLQKVARLLDNIIAEVGKLCWFTVLGGKSILVPKMADEQFFVIC